jgi:hypothetical protein
VEESKEKREVSSSPLDKGPALKHFSIGCCREKAISKQKGRIENRENTTQKKGRIKRTAIKDRASDTPNH